MRWTDTEIATILSMYADHTTTEIAEKLEGRTSNQVGGKIADLKERGHSLKKSTYFEETKSGKLTATNSVATRFKKGNVPYNKGMKGKGTFMAGGNKTSFKKGLVPHNTLSVGTIVEWHGDNRKYTYLRIKVADPNKWELLHRHVWQTFVGEIPEGYIVKFKDRNYQNCEPENLYLQNRQGNMLQNSIHNYPQELKDVMRLVKKLKKQSIKKRKTTMSKNNLGELKDTLFETLRKLSKSTEIEGDIKLANAIVEVSDTIVEVYKTEHAATKMMLQYGYLPTEETVEKLGLTSATTTKQIS